MGDYNVICDRTGFKLKRSQCVKEWNGLLVRKESAEPRHPQDFLKPINEREAVKDSRPEASDTFLNYGDVTVGDL